MSLAALQGEFLLTFARFVVLANVMHPEARLRFGESYRSDEQAEINAMGAAARGALATLIRPYFPLLAEKILNNGRANGIRGSQHEKRLAIDLMLDIGGEWVSDGAHPMWRTLGDLWEVQHPLARAGYKWGDANHLSFTTDGVK